MAARCAEGLPTVIAVAPMLEDGSPFPTTFWLTCPRLVEAVGALESAGRGAAFAARAQADPSFAAELASANSAYVAARTVEGSGADPCAGVGVAGQRDPLAVKCLHARLAAHLAGVPDPIGAVLAAELADLPETPCRDIRCRAGVGPGC